MSVYDTLFAGASYNNHEGDVERYSFVLDEIVRLQPFPSRLIDISSGRGCLLRLLPSGPVITSTDVRKYHDFNCEFLPLDLTMLGPETLAGRQFDLLSCLDVLEHVPLEHVDRALGLFARLAPRQFFGIANHSDVHNGVELHVIRENQEWWTKRLECFFVVLSCNVMYDGRLYQFVTESRS